MAFIIDVGTTFQQHSNEKVNEQTDKDGSLKFISKRKETILDGACAHSGSCKDCSRPSGLLTPTETCELEPLEDDAGLVLIQAPSS